MGIDIILCSHTLRHGQTVHISNKMMNAIKRDILNCPKGPLIDHGEGGGGYKMGRSRVPNFLRPTPLQIG